MSIIHIFNDSWDLVALLDFCLDHTTWGDKPSTKHPRLVKLEAVVDEKTKKNNKLPPGNSHLRCRDQFPGAIRIKISKQSSSNRLSCLYAVCSSDWSCFCLIWLEMTSLLSLIPPVSMVSSVLPQPWIKTVVRDCNLDQKLFKSACLCLWELTRWVLYYANGFISSPHSAGSPFDECSSNCVSKPCFPLGCHMTRDLICCNETDCWGDKITFSFQFLVNFTGFPR